MAEPLFALKLLQAGPSRVRLIVGVTSARPDLDLGRARNLVDALPQILKADLSLEEAERLKDEFASLAMVEVVHADGRPLGAEPIDCGAADEVYGPVDLSMPGDDFETTSIFTSDRGGGREFTSLSRPRLSFRDHWSPNRITTRTWMVDGDTRVSLAEAEVGLAIPPRLTEHEAAMLSKIGAEWTPWEELVGPTDGVVLEDDEPARRNQLALEGLQAKALIENAWCGTRLRIDGAVPPPLQPPPPRTLPPPTPEEARRTAIAARVVEVGSDLRLVPVLDWRTELVGVPEPSGYPKRGRFIDLGMVRDEAMLRLLVTSLAPELAHGKKAEFIFQGGFMLIEADRTLIAPGELGTLQDLRYWRATVQPKMARAIARAPDPRTGWTPLFIGASCDMVALTQDDVVWLCECRNAVLRIEPHPDHAIWAVPRKSLAAALAGAEQVLDDVGARLVRCLVGMVPENDLRPLVEWFLRGRGTYHTEPNVG